MSFVPTKSRQACTGSCGAGGRWRRTLALLAASPLLFLASVLLAGPACEARAGSPVEIGALDIPGAGRPIGLARAGSRVAVGRRGSPDLWLVETSDPAAPQILGSLEIAGTLRALAGRDRWVYAVGTRGGIARLHVVDALDRVEVGAVELGRLAPPLKVQAETSSRVRVTGRGLQGYVTLVLDVADPWQPSIVEFLMDSAAPSPPGAPAVPDYDPGTPVLAAVWETRGGSRLWDVLLLDRRRELRLVERKVANFADINGDGIFRLACLGDSNTLDRPAWAEAPGWCALLAAGIDDPFFERVEIAEIGATVTAQTVPELAGREARYHLLSALPFEPDIVVMAYGTNDIFQLRGTGAIVAAYLEHEATALSAGITQFAVSTTPRVGETNAISIASNTLLREAFAGRFFESFDGYTLAEHFRADGYHLNAAGQRKRAEEALALLGPR